MGRWIGGVVPPPPEERSDGDREQPAEPWDLDSIRRALDDVVTFGGDGPFVVDEGAGRLHERAVADPYLGEQVVARAFEVLPDVLVVGPHAGDRSTANTHGGSILVA
jgi:hypothetical protein